MTITRHTRQREEILRVLSEAKGPLSIQDILERAQIRQPGIGIATIYRNLKTLTDRGQIQSLVLPSGENRYERLGLGHHHHFQCARCSGVFDLDFCPIEFSQGTILPGGHLVQGHEITFFGVCNTCQETS